MVTGVPQELETICLKSDPRKSQAEMTRSTSSQTSVTPGFASILSSFLLLLSAASALLAHTFALDGHVQKKNVTTGVKKNSDSNGGGRLRHRLQGLSVNLSLTYH